MNTRLLLSFACLALTGLHLRAASVGFSSVAGTFDQGGSFTVGTSIDGTVTGNNGWGVFGGQTSSQSAVFTASSAVNASEIAFTFLHQAGFGGHHVQEFKLSTTTDPAPSAGSTWTPVSASSLKSTGGPTLGDVGGNTIRATGATGAGFANYQILATGAFAGVTGFLLELTPFDSGNGANLGASANGNFVLSEFLVTTDESINRAFAANATSSEATWSGFPPSNLTDGNIGTLTHPTGPGGVPPSVTNSGYYFQIDLGDTIAIDEIQLVPRQDGCCPERLSDYTVQVLDSSLSQVWSGDFRTDMSNPGLNTEIINAGDGAGTFTGRYVRVVNRNGADYNPQMSEVIVNGLVIPEPSGLVLGGIGVALLALGRRR